MNIEKKVWLTFNSQNIKTPTLWNMSKKFPKVSFNIRHASIKEEIGIIAVLFEGHKTEVEAAINFLREQGVTVDPIEKSIVEG